LLVIQQEFEIVKHDVTDIVKSKSVILIINAIDNLKSTIGLV